MLAHSADVHEECNSLSAAPWFINYTATCPQPPSQTSHPSSNSLLDVAFSSLTTGRLVSAASSINEPKSVCRTVMSFLVGRATSFFAEDDVRGRLCRVGVETGSGAWFEKVKTHTKRSLASIDVPCSKHSLTSRSLPRKKEKCMPYVHTRRLQVLRPAGLCRVLQNKELH